MGDLIPHCVMAPKTAFFTICSNNYLPFAQILFNSLKIHHPEAALFLCLADIQEPPLHLDGITVIEARALNIPTFEDFAFRYDVMEFNTAIKPFMMSWLLEEKQFEEVIYLDPDIEVFAPLKSVVDSLRQGAHFVLTPHLTQPAEIDAYPSDIDIMKAGIYNLGFIATSNHPEVYDFLHWWSRRLRFQCINRQDQGIFVDQKFIDLLPAFSDKVRILRETTLNIAYWNLDQRNLTYDDQKQQWLVDNQPLCFFHFSGINPKNRNRLSKHTSRFKSHLGQPLQKLIDHYIEQYQNVVSQGVYNTKYHYNYFNGNIKITALMRHYYRELEGIWLQEPFQSFHQYLNQVNLNFLAKNDHLEPVLVTNLMYIFWGALPGLQDSFALESSADMKSFMYWFVQYAFVHDIDPYFVQPVADCLARNLDHACPPVIDSHQNQDLVGIIGYLRAEMGVGQASRTLLQSLEKRGVSLQGYDVDLNIVARREDKSVEHCLVDAVTAPIHLYKINGDQLGLVKEYITPKLNQANYQIAMPAWELSFFPQEWVGNFEGINEIWVESQFVRAALQPKFTIPVYCLPPAIVLGNYQPKARAFFHLPEDAFLFHFNFDFSSYSSRKNPEGAIKAYRRAFRRQPGPIPTALVIKVRGYDPNNLQLKHLLAVIQDEPDIILINQQLSYSDSIALMNCCDCYVSLHRSEGFGYTIAEAMLLGKRVITTDFSGTKDFVNPKTGFPVNYKLIPLNADDYPFAENQFWADPDLEQAAWLMRQMVTDEKKTQMIAYNGQDYIKTVHSLAAAGDRYLKRFQQLDLVDKTFAP
ncbi:MAG: glycosyltransferase [Synechocystis sp.]|nr:glycosyltransferase [Synechocystis sp.]